MMDQPTTSKPKADNKQIKHENLGPLTTKTLKRLIWKLKLDQTSNYKIIPLPLNELSDPVSRTARYTGMHRLNIEKLLAFGEIFNYEPLEIDRQIIHANLIQMYTLRNHIPTVTELFNSLYELLPMYVDLDLFTKILIRMGYVFYKFPGSKALRVMEKKSVMFERYRYLKSIQEYRKDKLPIVYVGFASLNKKMNLLNLERTLQTDPKNIVNHVLFTATVEEIGNIKIISSSPYEALPDIIKKWLLPTCTSLILPPGSICVLEDSKIFRETLIDVPTWKSVKADMVEWLEEHNISCNVDMPKADLLQLIETCTDSNKNTFVIDNLLKPYNYSLLRLPHCINGLSIVPLVIKTLNDKECFKNSLGVDLVKIFESVSSTDLKLFSSMIVQQEKNQLHEDIKIDDILDDLVREIKTLDDEGNEDDVILPYSDSE